MFVDQVEAILPSSGKGALDILSFVINTLTDIILHRYLCTSQDLSCSIRSICSFMRSL